MADDTPTQEDLEEAYRVNRPLIELINQSFDKTDDTLRRIENAVGIDRENPDNEPILRSSVSEIEARLGGIESRLDRIEKRLTGWTSKGENNDGL